MQITKVMIVGRAMNVVHSLQLIPAYTPKAKPLILHRQSWQIDRGCRADARVLFKIADLEV